MILSSRIDRHIVIDTDKRDIDNMQQYFKGFFITKFYRGSWNIFFLEKVSVIQKRLGTYGLHCGPIPSQ